MNIKLSKGVAEILIKNFKIYSYMVCINVKNTKKENNKLYVPSRLIFQLDEINING